MRLSGRLMTDLISLSSREKESESREDETEGKRERGWYLSPPGVVVYKRVGERDTARLTPNSRASRDASFCF